jgi:S-(hydroxymethyl)glutathione dehydrogenase/alcohol dehydrogenase
VLHGLEQEFQVQEIELDEPKEREVLVRLAATGLCHSDYHLVTGDIPVPFPIVPGHEGAGVVERVGPGVTRIKPGDHVLLIWIPACGQCRFCSMGQSMLCDRGARLLDGHMLDGTTRMHATDGSDVFQYAFISTFSEYTVCPDDACVVVPPDMPMDTVCLVGCGVATGFGAAINRAAVQAGDRVAVFGIGGVGINAVQGAALQGASSVIAVDPSPLKREMAEQMGATDTIDPSQVDPVARILELTDGVGADKTIVTIDYVKPSHIGDAVNAVRKGGRAVIVGVPHPDLQHADLNLFEFVLFQKEVLGCLYGTSNPQADIARYLDLYRAGKLKVDELVTRTYALEDINAAYRDLLDGKNIRGVVRF